MMTHQWTTILEGEGKDSFEDRGTIINQLRWVVRSTGALRDNMIVVCFLGAMVQIWMMELRNPNRFMPT